MILKVCIKRRLRGETACEMEAAHVLSVFDCIINSSTEIPASQATFQKDVGSDSEQKYPLLQLCRQIQETEVALVP